MRPFNVEDKRSLRSTWQQRQNLVDFEYQNALLHISPNVSFYELNQWQPIFCLEVLCTSIVPYISITFLVDITGARFITYVESPD